MRSTACLSGTLAGWWLVKSDAPPLKVETTVEDAVVVFLEGLELDSADVVAAETFLLLARKLIALTVGRPRRLRIGSSASVMRYVCVAVSLTGSGARTYVEYVAERS